MPIYLLERAEFTGYAECVVKIIRAKSVKEARIIANLNTESEGEIWNNLIKVKCTHIEVLGQSKEILSSFNAG